MSILNRSAQYRLKRLEHLNRMVDCQISKQLPIELEAEMTERCRTSEEALELPDVVYLFGLDKLCVFNPCCR